MMIKNLKVKILKKSKEAPYPEHIIVERPETHELVHLYFNEGTLSKLTHIKRDSQIKMTWNERGKKYEALLPSYTVFQECLIRDGQLVYTKGLKDRDFFKLSFSRKWRSQMVEFKPSAKTLPDFFVEMDSDFKCTPNAYIRHYDTVEIGFIYPHQKRRTCPSCKNFKQHVRS